MEQIITIIVGVYINYYSLFVEYMYVETNWAHKDCGFANNYVQKFAAINGILFPGGSTSLKGGPFYQTGEKLFNVQTTNPDSFLLC
jgi:hypothetical protein